MYEYSTEFRFGALPSSSHPFSFLFLFLRLGSTNRAQPPRVASPWRKLTQFRELSYTQSQGVSQRPGVIFL
ncbi:hypothetical protein C8R44DRAFT_769177 [Mycena epipterygia]|nr:hypothetical protein C8R44DRAFT_769177 [Mycena epipterygia]